MPRIWIDSFVNETVSVAGGDLQSLMSGVTPAQTRFDQMTLLRTLIGLDIARTVHDSGEGSELLAIGIGIASQTAFALGLTGVSDPEIATDFPTRGWVWRAKYRTFGFAADQPAVFVRRVDLDIRAMRKLENGEAYIVMGLTALEGVSSAVSVTGLIRQLWLVG